jgi:pyruvate kinase
LKNRAANGVVCYFALICCRPALSTVSDVIKLFDAGMTMARINISHGNMKTNLKLLALYAEAKRLRPHKTCALLVDIRGREIRLSTLRQE